MQIGMRMEQKQKLSLDYGLDDAEKARIELALELYETRPVSQFDVPSETLRAIFNASNSPGLPTRPKLPASASDPTEHDPLEDPWHEEFMVISPAEMAKFDEDERYAILIGNCAFISSEVPADFIPMIVMNIAALRRSREDTPLAQRLIDRGVPRTHTRHYTATLTDVFTAQYVFRNDTKRLAEFLAWRRSVERSGFFDDSTIGEILKEKFKARQRNRTLHPTERGRHAKRSFLLAAAMEVTMTREQIDQVATSFAVTKADLIVGRIRSERSFNLDEMLLTIDECLRQVSELKKGPNIPKAKRVIRLNGWQSVQAYLLTADVSGNSHLLESSTDANTYRYSMNVRASLQALRDRLVYLGQKALERRVPDKADLRILQSLILNGGLRIDTSLAPVQKIVPSDAHSGNEVLAGIEPQRAELARKKAEAEVILAQYEEIARSFAEIGAQEAVPGVLAQDAQVVREHIIAIDKQTAELAQYEEVLARLAEVRLKHQRLFSEIVVAAD